MIPQRHNQMTPPWISEDVSGDHGWRFKRGKFEKKKKNFTSWKECKHNIKIHVNTGWSPPENTSKRYWLQPTSSSNRNSTNMEHTLNNTTALLIVPVLVYCWGVGRRKCNYYNKPAEEFGLHCPKIFNSFSFPISHLHISFEIIVLFPVYVSMQPRQGLSLPSLSL